MKKICAIVVFAASFHFYTIPVCAQALIREVTGTVEIMLPGSNEWESAEQGRTVPAETVISTGFRSIAVVVLGGAVLTVRPVTRISLAELSRMEGVDTIQMNLQSGRVRVDVQAPAGSRTDFTIQTPSAVASVRGTVFEIDTINISVIEGTVEFAGAANVPVFIDARSSSFADDRTGRAALPEETSVTDLRPSLPIASDYIAPYNRPSSDDSMGLQASIDF